MHSLSCLIIDLFLKKKKGCARFMNCKNNLNQPFVPANKTCGLEHFIIRKRRKERKIIREREKDTAKSVRLDWAPSHSHMARGD